MGVPRVARIVTVYEFDDGTFDVTAFEKQSGGIDRPLGNGSREQAAEAVAAALLSGDVQPEWCPVCKTYHPDPGSKTDAGVLTRPCPQLDAEAGL